MSAIKALWATNPVRVVSLGSSALVAAAALVGVAVDEAQVSAVLAVVLPLILGGGELARAQVSPAVGEVGPDNDDLLPDPPKPRRKRPAAK
jgi:hypothetical protein